MALVKKPTDDENLSFDAKKDNDSVIALDESGDIENQNLSYSGLVDFIESKFNKSKDSRYSDENRWLNSYRNYRGIYSTDVQFNDTEKSRAFIKITKTKVLAAYAQIIDVLFAGNKFPLGSK